MSDAAAGRPGGRGPAAATTGEGYSAGTALCP